MVVWSASLFGALENRRPNSYRHCCCRCPAFDSSTLALALSKQYKNVRNMSNTIILLNTIMNNSHAHHMSSLKLHFKVASLAAGVYHVVGHLFQMNKNFRKLCVETCTIPGVVCITELDLFTYRIPPLPIVTGCMLAVWITDDWLACITDWT